MQSFCEAYWDQDNYWAAVKYFKSDENSHNLIIFVNFQFLDMPNVKQNLQPQTITSLLVRICVNLVHAASQYD